MAAAPESEQPPASALGRLDAFMARSPWHPRLVPFFAYIVGLFVIGVIADAYLPAYPVLYTLQCAVVVWLLWRYRRLLPEMTLRFHWTVVPSAVLLTAAWVGLGYGYNLLLLGERDPLVWEAEDTFRPLFEMSLAYGWAALVLRLLGMSLVVPFFEELFIRSAMLRSLHDWKTTRVGLVQIATDLPLIGEWVSNTGAGKRAEAMPPQLTRNLETVPLGAVTVFATAASTFVFMMSHAWRDWAGCIACGVVWCAMVGWTNRASLAPEQRAGLGPVIWSHGLVNALLWGYTLWSGDWQFL